MKNTVLTFITVLVFTLGYSQNDKPNLKFNEKTNLIEAQYFHDNGILAQKGTYTAEGKLHGDWLKFDDNGQKLASATYENGKKVGTWMFINANSIKEVTYSGHQIVSVVKLDRETGIAIND